MKKLIFLIGIHLLTSSIYAQENQLINPPRIDKRVELLSIVFRLAGNPEYNYQTFPLYTEKIEAYFGKYKKHKLIRFIQKKLHKRGIAYDAVMQMAIHITQPPEMQPLVPFTDEIPENRWGKKNAVKFLKLLNEFYTDARCEDFFEENAGLYQKVEQRFYTMYKEIDLDWYQRFYGIPPENLFEIIIGLGNGPGNYGPKLILPNKHETVYAIMGIYEVDEQGLPIYFSKGYLPILIHEFNHSFVNKTVEKFHNELQKAGEILYEKVLPEMQRQAYGNWQTLFNESVVRAAVIIYMKEHNYDEKSINKEMTRQLNRGFYWMEGLVKELENYEQNRKQYPDLESFMPKIVKFFNKTTTQIDELKQKIEKKRPVIVSIKPFVNNESQVDYHIKQIIVTFDKEIQNKRLKILSGEKTFPEITHTTLSKDQKSFIMDVKLQPDTEYQLILSGWYFKSKENYSIKDYDINFKTKK